MQKTVKKSLAVLLALVFACSASLAAFAFSAEPKDDAPAALALKVSTNKERYFGRDTIKFAVAVTNQTADEMTDVAIYASVLSCSIRIFPHRYASLFGFGNGNDDLVAVISTLAPGETKTVTVPCKVNYPFINRLIDILMSLSWPPAGGFFLEGGRSFGDATTVSVGKSLSTTDSIYHIYHATDIISVSVGIFLPAKVSYNFSASCAMAEPAAVN